MSPFEAAMLICFGLSWPISILKALRTRKVEGKSPLFMVILILGYTMGILHKVFYNMDWVVSLYALNACLVGFDLMLYYRFLPRAATK